MTDSKFCILLTSTLITACAGMERRPVTLADNAPVDTPAAIVESEDAPGAAVAFYQAIEPCVAHARESYPEAKQRYKNGLPEGFTFFVTTRLRDETGRKEQVFVVVDQIRRNEIDGRIANEIQLVNNFVEGQVIRFPETEVYDWTISNPDGSEEGNFIGKFLDTGEPCEKQKVSLQYADDFWDAPPFAEPNDFGHRSEHEARMAGELGQHEHVGVVPPDLFLLIGGL